MPTEEIELGEQVQNNRERNIILDIEIHQPENENKVQNNAPRKKARRDRDRKHAELNTRSKDQDRIVREYLEHAHKKDHGIEWNLHPH